MSESSRPVTIRDIAATTGLSVATISLALRKHPRISAATREKVVSAAESLGYRPNPMMAAHWETVRARKPGTFQAVIAVITDWESYPLLQSNPWQAPAFQSMLNRAERLGYKVEEFSIADKSEAARTAKLKSTLRILRSRGIYAAIFLFPAHPSMYSAFKNEFQDFAIVFVCSEYQHVERSMDQLQHVPFHRTNPDLYGNMLTLLEALKSAGYRRPGFWPNTWGEARTAGESSAAFNFWIQSLPPADQIPVKWTKWKVDPPLETSRQQFLKWLPAKKPDVVICQQIEVCDWIRSLGLKIPEDIGLVHTDLGPPEVGWSGIDCRVPGIAAAGIDLLTAHLHRNERGIPEIAKDVKIEGVWVQAKTTRSL